MITDKRYAEQLKAIERRVTADDRRGESLERAIDVSAEAAMVVRKMSAESRWLRGRIIPRKGVVDYIGCIPGGRMICFEAKECEIPTRFNIGDTSVFPFFQRDFLITFGVVGAIAGLVLEAKALNRFYWLDWQYLVNDTSRSIKWNDSRLLQIGEDSRRIHFERIPGMRGADS